MESIIKGTKLDYFVSKKSRFCKEIFRERKVFETLFLL